MGIFSPKSDEKHELQLGTYTINFSLDRLVPGVDNIHYDVYLSPLLCKISRRIAGYLISKYAEVNERPQEAADASEWVKLKEEFKQCLVDVMLGAINKAKLEREIQINFLAQTAVAKMLIEEVRAQFNSMVEHYKTVIRKHEVSRKPQINTVIQLKEELSGVQRNKKRINQLAAREIFQYFSESQRKELRNIREANFGVESILPKNFFSNPVLHAENVSDDLFMIEEYVLFGNRLEDPLRYDALLSLYGSYLNSLMDNKEGGAELPPREAAAGTGDPKGKPGGSRAYESLEIESRIKQIENVDALFNTIQTEDRLKSLKRKNSGKEEIQLCKMHLKRQKERLHLFYKQVSKKKIMNGIIACYEMNPLYKQYCPPLYPHEVLKYLINPKERNNVALKLKRLKGPSGKPLSLRPLRKLTTSLNRIPQSKKKEYLIQFMKSFVRYHRDLQDYSVIKEAMDWINLPREEKTLNLSRVNHTLYEFLLPREQIFEEKPIVNHVIVKTDVRGSTDITHQIKERGLNPASYFSLNFFNPITAILPEYGASKVFIEGDAIILSIFEKEETPEDWYSVARACGLAINMLLITKRYNAQSKKHRLPILEQGIGICYRNSPPTFLFDGDNRIMISPAINLADRLSGCTRSVRKILGDTQGPFNLYVYQTNREESLEATADDVYSRYNVNGIELNAEGFEKLKEEINLKKVPCHFPELVDEPFTAYTGIFPTISGRYQRLVIREASIPLVKADSLKFIKNTTKKYYEVCTHPKLYELVKKTVKQE